MELPVLETIIRTEGSTYIPTHTLMSLLTPTTFVTHCTYITFLNLTTELFMIIIYSVAEPSYSIHTRFLQLLHHIVTFIVYSVQVHL